MAKFRTRDYTRSVNPFTDEPWRTPGEFFSDAMANAEAKRLDRLERRQAKRKYTRLTKEDQQKLDYLLEKMEEMEDDE